MKRYASSMAAVVLAAVACGPAFMAAAARAQAERITSFDSRITVHPDSRMTVRETIMAVGAGRRIKRGIYREFPTDYTDLSGNRYVVGFRVKEVLRDGRPEPYHMKRRSNGERVYIGRKNVFVPHGEHTYTIVYETDRQLGFFEDHDELYWNVTGNGWAFPIESASATVELPPGVPKDGVKLEAYTGPRGAVGRDYTASFTDEGLPAFRTTKELGPREGLTIVVSWPKGYVQAPTRSEELRYVARDNLGAALGVLGLAALLVYYLAVWAMVGKDPAGGTVIPLYTPPRGLSPSAMRFIVRMGYDRKAFTSAIINMAVKGFLAIREKGGKYTLEKVGDDTAALTREEKGIAKKLFRLGREIELIQKNHAKIGGAVKALKASLKAHCEKDYFVRNRRFFIPGVVISVITLILSTLLSGAEGAGVPVLFISIWLTIWTIGIIALAATVIAAWRGVSSGGGVAAAVAVTLFAVPFVGGEVLGIVLLVNAASVPLIFILLAVAAINCLFYHLLKAPTRAGRDILDLIEGFKMYLSVAEKERLALLNPPDKTPDLFERYLPYALALDVENAWAEKFADVLSRAGRAGTGYMPSWYSGRSWSDFGAHGFTGSLGGAFSSAIASSSVAPGSSSGRSGGFSGGGGSSGGGGGGGGGGGW